MVAVAHVVVHLVVAAHLVGVAYMVAQLVAVAFLLVVAQFGALVVVAHLVAGDLLVAPEFPSCTTHCVVGNRMGEHHNNELLSMWS